MYVLINRAPDGRHIRAFKTKSAALKALADFMGRDHDYGEPLVANRTYISDWGNALTVEQRVKGHTASIERRLADAYDARECGTATSAQIALLEKLGY